MTNFIEDFGQSIRKCDFRKGATLSIKVILLILLLTFAPIERGFGFDEPLAREGERVIGELGSPGHVQYQALSAQQETLGEPDINVKNFGPLWSSFYGGRVDYSPDGHSIAVGGRGAVFLLDAKTYQIERQLFGHRALVYAVKWSPDGQYLASGGGDFDDTVKIWDGESGDLIATLEGPVQRVTSVAWSPDGDMLAAAANNGGVILWDVKTGTMMRRLVGASCVTWSPDGKYVATSRDYGVVIYEVGTGDMVRTFGDLGSFVQTVAWSPDGQYIASGAFGAEVLVSEAATGRSVRTLLHGLETESLAWSPDGAYLACGGGFVKIWETETWNPIRTLGSAIVLDIRSVSWSPDGTYVVSGGGRVVNIWEVKTGTSLVSLEGHRNQVTSVAWSPDGRYLVSGTDATPYREAAISIKIWDVKTVTAIRTLCEGISCGYGTSLDWSPDGRYIASSSSDVVLWDAETGKEVNRFYGVGGGVKWSPDGKYLASIYYNTINVLEADTGSLIEAIEVETTQYVLSVAWSPDGNYLASSGYNPDSTVKIWEVGTWELVATFPGLTRIGISSLTWSPDSQYVAGLDRACCLWGIKIWELETGRLVRRIDSDPEVFSLMWSPDGKYLASGQALGRPGSTVKIWDAKTGDLIKTLLGHNDYVSSVAWSPDGRYIASGSYDSTVRVWGEPPKD